MHSKIPNKQINEKSLTSPIKQPLARISSPITKNKKLHFNYQETPKTELPLKNIMMWLSSILLGQLPIFLPQIANPRK